MNERILDISSSPALVSVRNGLLCVEAQGHEPVTVPPGDVAALVASHYAVTVTREALAQLAASGAQCIICDRKQMPVAMLLPLGLFHQPASRLAAQAAAGRPLRKRLWRQLVRSKVRSQAAVLSGLGRADPMLAALAAEVTSGDKTNVEAQAARRYWPRLMGETFRRDADAEDANRLLNYAYALLRACTCRAICGAGLHPGLGLHHHHRANAFCLADDLMEPFRPLADRHVLRVLEARRSDSLTSEVKRDLMELLRDRVEVGGECRVLFDALTRLALSLAAVLEGRRKSLVLPEWS